MILEQLSHVATQLICVTSLGRAEASVPLVHRSDGCYSQFSAAMVIAVCAGLMF